ncbi:MAG TPA: hypothetical protein VGB17_08550 [Pyrinomonadaceae bacterium]|jgi:hypothetical protein
MIKLKHCTAALFFLLALWTIQPNKALAQQPNAFLFNAGQTAASDSLNHDIQLYLLVGSSEGGERGAVPSALDGVVKQLRSTMPFSNYRLAATFFNRVKNGGSLNVKGVAGSLFPSNAGPNTPTFYEFNLSDIKMDAGQQVVQIEKFRFGLRVPIVTYNGQSNDNKGGSPILSYEPIGINTELGISANTPTIIGTMTTGRADESFILIILDRPTSPR